MAGALRRPLVAGNWKMNGVSGSQTELARIIQGAGELAALDEEPRFDRMCELNVVEQVVNVCQTTIVADAWARGQDLTVHGLVYGLEDGLLRDLGVSASTG